MGSEMCIRDSFKVIASDRHDKRRCGWFSPHDGFAQTSLGAVEVAPSHQLRRRKKTVSRGVGWHRIAVKGLFKMKERFIMPITYDEGARGKEVVFPATARRLRAEGDHAFKRFHGRGRISHSKKHMAVRSPGVHRRSVASDCLVAFGQGLLMQMQAA